MSERLLTNALIEELENIGVAVGDGEQPDGVGWAGAPDQSVFTPWCVVHPLLGGWVDGTLGEPHADPQILYQISCYGATREQAQWVVDLIHPAALALRPADVKVIHADVDMLGGARRDDTAPPPVVRQSSSSRLLRMWCWPIPVMYTGGRGMSRARSADVTTNAPPPSETRQQSSSRSGSTIMRECM